MSDGNEIELRVWATSIHKRMMLTCVELHKQGATSKELMDVVEPMMRYYHELTDRINELSPKQICAASVNS